MNKRTIAIVAGGFSREHDVSMRSAQGILSAIDKERYQTYIIEITHESWKAILPNGEHSIINKNDFSFQGPEGVVKPDFAYITIHGTPGENGILQGYFDLIGLPYSTCNVLVEALTFNKFALNQYLKAFGVKIADSLLLRKQTEAEVSDDDIINRIGLPCFVKPCADGSSFGVSRVNLKEELRGAIRDALQGRGEAMVEAFISGTEITCGCYKTKDKSVVFPITEVVTDETFFNYEAKYNGASQEITPARIPNATAERVSRLTSAIYDILGCEGIIRIDYILSGEKGHETINLLEINTTPGMTNASFIPQQVRAAGLSMTQVLTDIIENKFK